MRSGPYTGEALTWKLRFHSENEAVKMLLQCSVSDVEACTHL